MRAVLFTYTADGQNFATPFEGCEGPGRDPFHRAQALKESLEADWPGAIWSIGIDEEAREAMADTRMVAMLGPDWKEKR